MREGRCAPDHEVRETRKTTGCRCSSHLRKRTHRSGGNQGKRERQLDWMVWMGMWVTGRKRIVPPVNRLAHLFIRLLDFAVRVLIRE